MTDEGLAAPVHGDKGEQAVFDLFHLVVPGGRCATVTFSPVSLAKRCNSRFHSFTCGPLLPPQSAVIVRQVALE